MARYLIENPHSGLSLGVYEGDTKAAALNAMARDAGYADYAEAYEAAGDGATLSVTEEATS